VVFFVFFSFGSTGSIMYIISFILYKLIMKSIAVAGNILRFAALLFAVSHKNEGECGVGKMDW